MNSTAGEVEWVRGLDEYGSDEELAAVWLFAGYPEPLLRFASVCCAVCMLAGVPGNLVTIVALARCNKVRNATAVFIMNLSSSDLLFCCFNLPLAATTFWQQRWTHGRLLCYLFPYARYSLVAVSMVTVLAITVSRFILISYPHLYNRFYRRGINLAVMIGSLWVLCCGTLLLTLFEKWGRFSLSPSVGSCTIIPDRSHTSPKKFLFTVLLLPSIAIAVLYIRIFVVVRRSEVKNRAFTRRCRKNAHKKTVQSIAIVDDEPMKSNDVSKSLTTISFALSVLSNKDASTHDVHANGGTTPLEARVKSNPFTKFLPTRLTMRIPKTPASNLPTSKDMKLLTMIVAIMLSFGVCHVPIIVTKIVKEFTASPALNIFSYILLFLSPCINPLIYVLMSSEYRQAYRQLFVRRRGPAPGRSEATSDVRVRNQILINVNN